MSKSSAAFTRYQVFVIVILSLLQFTIILDFMVLSPLGVILLKELSINTAQFGVVVSAYAFSAAISGILTAGFADKFDRKKLILFFYVGFLLGTVLCAIAPNFHFLLMARVVTGIFGGVVGSVGAAIITDLFKLETRGRVMGFVQMSFALAQVAGIPIGFSLAEAYNWHLPFTMIASLGAVLGIVIAVYMKPVDEHLRHRVDRNAFHHLFSTVVRPDYLKTYAATALLATGGFMMMPLGSTFSANNLGIDVHQLPKIYVITGFSTIVLGPLIGKLSDSIGKFKIFLFGSMLSMTVIAFYSHLGITPLWEVIILTVVMFIGITSRMISAGALFTAVPDQKDRGAFMSVNTSIQQVAGGFGAMAAGWIVVQAPSGKLQHYDVLGYVVIGTMLVALLQMHYLNQRVQKKLHTHRPV